jgi:type VI protein secretion system component Hcp
MVVGAPAAINYAANHSPFFYPKAMISIYLRLTDYNGKALAPDGTTPSSTPLDGIKFDVRNQQFSNVLAYNGSVEQTLSIGSQSSGVGTGKISFNPFVITKSLDAMSPLLFQASATGTAYKTAEIVFVIATSDQPVILSRLVYKMAAIKTISWAAGEDDRVLETIAFDYGGLFVAVNKQSPDGRVSGGTQAGWNRIKNISDNTPDGASMK